MRKSVVAIAAAFMLPVAAGAQNAPAISPLVSIEYLDVATKDMMRFDETAKKFVEAARQANLKAEYAWDTWMSDNTYAIVSGLPSMAFLEDPMQWMKQFEGTPGKPLLDQAMQGFKGANMRARSEVLAYMPAWSYAPANPSQQPRYAEVLEAWMVGGMDQEFDALIKDVVKVLGQASYPFQVIGYHTRIGDGRAMFVILYDDPVRYETEVKRLDENAAWQALRPRWLPLVMDTETRRWMHRPDLSYAPAMPGGGS